MKHTIQHACNGTSLVILWFNPISDNGPRPDGTKPFPEPTLRYHKGSCGVWCRGLATCLLHVGPPFGNGFLNNSWAVGVTWWIVYLIFLYFDICNYICLDTSYHFWLYLYFLNILYFFKYPVLTSSIDVVFILSTNGASCNLAEENVTKTVIDITE